MTKEEIINKKLSELTKSDFRRGFKLKEKDILYVKDKGIGIIRQHAYDFINDRLKGYPLFNDGKQTPMKGHPVFIAQHATGTCCRSCLNKWHGIDKTREMSRNEVNYIVELIITWISKQI